MMNLSDPQIIAQTFPLHSGSEQDFSIDILGMVRHNCGKFGYPNATDVARVNATQMTPAILDQSNLNRIGKKSFN